MQFADFKDKSKEELKELLTEKKEDLRILKFKVSEQQLKQVHTIKQVKQQITWIVSLLEKNTLAH